MAAIGNLIIDWERYGLTRKDDKQADQLMSSKDTSWGLLDIILR